MYQYAAKNLVIIDADTVILDIDLGFYLHRLKRSYRLARINAPERYTDTGKLAIEALKTKLATVKAYQVTTSKADQWDRWIVELYADGENISDWLVSNGHAIYQTYRVAGD